VKDVFPTKGLRTTFGSPIYRDHVPEEDHVVVAREKAAGAVILGKTSTPPFAKGGQTRNPISGLTRNPYDLTKSVSGSSGGASAALAAGFVALADGSDIGGSLRSPAAWCNVVGFRPSPGRVPHFPVGLLWNGLSVPGPMARCVEDVALFMRALSGPDPRVPLSLEESGEIFARDLVCQTKDLRLAWSVDGIGTWHSDAAVRRHFEGAVKVFEDLGCDIREAMPDLSGGMQVYYDLVCAKRMHDRSRDYAKNKHLLEPGLCREIEHGLSLSAAQLLAVEEKRGQIWHRLAAFLEDFDFLIWPVNLMLAYDAEDEVAEDDAPWDTVMLTPIFGLPAISVPAGFTEDGMPAGIQIIGKRNRDFQVLQLARAFEAREEHWRQRPSL
jgi:amidase